MFFLPMAWFCNFILVPFQLLFTDPIMKKETRYLQTVLIRKSWKIIVNCMFLIMLYGISQSVKGCDRSQMTLDSVVCEGGNYRVYVELCIGGGITGALKGAGATTRTIAFGFWRRALRSHGHQGTTRKERLNEQFIYPTNFSKPKKVGINITLLTSIDELTAVNLASTICGEIDFKIYLDVQNIW